MTKITLKHILSVGIALLGRAWSAPVDQSEPSMASHLAFNSALTSSASASFPTLAGMVSTSASNFTTLSTSILNSNSPICSQTMFTSTASVTHVVTVTETVSHTLVFWSRAPGSAWHTTVVSAATQTNNPQDYTSLPASPETSSQPVPTYQSSLYQPDHASYTTTGSPPTSAPTALISTLTVTVTAADTTTRLIPSTSFASAQSGSSSASFSEKITTLEVVSTARRTVTKIKNVTESSSVLPSYGTHGSNSINSSRGPTGRVSWSTTASVPTKSSATAISHPSLNMTLSASHHLHKSKGPTILHTGGSSSMLSSVVTTMPRHGTAAPQRTITTTIFITKPKKTSSSTAATSIMLSSESSSSSTCGPWDKICATSMTPLHNYRRSVSPGDSKDTMTMSPLASPGPDYTQILTLSISGPFRTPPKPYGGRPRHDSIATSMKGRFESQTSPVPRNTEEPSQSIKYTDTSLTVPTQSSKTGPWEHDPVPPLPRRMAVRKRQPNVFWGSWFDLWAPAVPAEDSSSSSGPSETRKASTAATSELSTSRSKIAHSTTYLGLSSTVSIKATRTSTVYTSAPSSTNPSPNPGYEAASVALEPQNSTL
ncbi:hypothetical protein NA57DRAFT_51720 [Rhizodiscina lignyota]|uniref:Uncharacterized protein n=1 Tax=Rhizodiscina lignyota TaxID=1504668 RepID=A0A9P4IRW6_9PEZI|nr:hypothetical protein NA57DRAFT_51720 [Rhizodiscina lignyota]